MSETEKTNSEWYQILFEMTVQHLYLSLLRHPRVYCSRTSGKSRVHEDSRLVDIRCPSLRNDGQDLISQRFWWPLINDLRLRRVCRPSMTRMLTRCINGSLRTLSISLQICPRKPRVLWSAYYNAILQNAWVRMAAKRSRDIHSLLGTSIGTGMTSFLSHMRGHRLIITFFVGYSQEKSSRHSSRAL